MVLMGALGRGNALGSESGEPPVRTVFVTLTLVEAEELVGGYTAEVTYDPNVYTPISCVPARVCNAEYRDGVAKASSFSTGGFEPPADLMYLVLIGQGEGAISSGELSVVDLLGETIEGDAALSVEPPAFPLGDVTCNESVDGADVTALLRYFAIGPANGGCGPHGPDRNMDCDTMISLGDVLALLQYIAEVDASLGC